MTVSNRPHISVPSIEVCHDRPFFNRAQGRAFEVRAADMVTEIDLYDEIGYWGVTASDFRRQIRGVKTPRIALRINSPGGDVFDGIAMYNDLAEHDAEVEVQVTGLAASAASIVAMAGDRVSMADNAFMMIHNAWALAIGDRNDMTAMAGVLEKIDGALAETYAARADGSAKDFAALMDDETWLTAGEAVDLGLADSAEAAEDVAARFDLSVFHRTPKALKAPTADGPATKRDFERALRDAGASKTVAAGMVAAGYQAVAGGRREAGDGAADLSTLAGPLRALRHTIQGA